MKLTHILTALAVMVGLYFWVGSPLTAEQFVRASAEGAAAQQEAPPVKVVAFRSVAQPVASALVLRGRTEAHRSVELRAETPGLVVSQPRRAGARVEEGDLLCRLDPGERLARLEESRARVAQAQADNDAAEALVERGITAANTAIARRAALQAAQAQLRAAELDLARLEIRAPFSGVLETDAAEIGALLRVGDLCARVISLEPIEIVGFVAETDVERVGLGEPAYARLISGREVAGEITFVSRSADDTTRTFRVEITAPNPGGAIRDGLTAEILIPTESGEAHLTPQNVLTLDDAGRMGVRIVEDGRARFVAVEVLREERQGLWLQGLPDQADIIFVGQDYVADGRAVDMTLEEWSPTR